MGDYMLRHSFTHRHPFDTRTARTQTALRQAQCTTQGPLSDRNGRAQAVLRPTWEKQ
jgi:hypothetical protein